MQWHKTLEVGAGDSSWVGVDEDFEDITAGTIRTGIMQWLMIMIMAMDGEDGENAYFLNAPLLCFIFIWSNTASTQNQL